MTAVDIRLDHLAIAARYAAAPEEWPVAPRFNAADRWYHRLAVADDYEVWLLTWLPGQGTDLHDHGGSSGAFLVFDGTLTEETVTADDTLAAGRTLAAHQTPAAQQTPAAHETLAVNQTLSGTQTLGANQTLGADQTIAASQTLTAGKTVSVSRTLTAGKTLAGKEALDPEVAVTHDAIVVGEGRRPRPIMPPTAAPAAAAGAAAAGAGAGAGAAAAGAGAGAGAAAAGAAAAGAARVGVRVTSRELGEGAGRRFGPGHIHRVSNRSSRPTISIHVYGPALTTMTRYRLSAAGLEIRTVETAGVQW